MQRRGKMEKSEDCCTDIDLTEVVAGSNMEATTEETSMDRCESQMSSTSERQDICRICHCENEEGNKLYSPCLCLGSLKYVHVRCLQKWIKSSEKLSCELCHFEYLITTKTKPFKEWERLDMSTAERRKIICSVAFHVIAITCVIWSLYVLIDRTTEEVSNGNLNWPFWTKLIVVAIGFTGGLVFMYVQCKMYVQLVMRWRAYNRVIQVDNVPETEEFRTNALAKIKARMEEGNAGGGGGNGNGNSNNGGGDNSGGGGVTNAVALQEVEGV